MEVTTKTLDLSASRRIVLVTSELICLNQSYHFQVLTCDGWMTMDLKESEQIGWLLNYINDHIGDSQEYSLDEHMEMRQVWLTPK